MRVRGDIAPDALTIETYMPKDGYVEVRLRENIRAITEIDEQTKSTITVFEYDEYVFHIKNKEGLKEEIEKNRADWLATGKNLEVDMQSTIVQDMQTEAIEELAAVIDEIYNEDLASIEE